MAAIAPAFEKLSAKMEAVPQSFQRIHPGLPTFAETAANPNIAYSDHLPILARVPLTERGTNGFTLNLLSLNTLGLNLYSGIHQDHTLCESLEEIQARYTRIANFLKLSIEHNDLDCIILQETELNVMLPILQEILGEDWICIPSKTVAPSKEGEIKVENGLITCYNTKKLKAISEATFDKQQRVLSQSFHQYSSEKIIHLRNSWGNFSHNPHIREQEYKTLLTANPRNKDVHTIVGGDSNGDIVPLHAKLHKTATTSIPPTILRQNDHKYSKENPPQAPDNPDGVFYTDHKGHIRQMYTEACDFSTGKPFPPEALEISAEEFENPGYRVTEYRLVLCLDHSYADAEYIEGKTLAEYEVELQKRASDPKIQVSIAANSRNEKALAIWCLGSTSNFYKFLKTLPNVKFVFIEGSSEPMSIIFIPLEQVPKLVVAIEQYPQLEAKINIDMASLLQQIDAEIDRLEPFFGFEFFNKSSPIKIEILKELRMELASSEKDNDKKVITQYEVQSIIRRWENRIRIVSEDDEDVAKTYGELLGEHRGKLRGIFSDEDELTATSLFVHRLKTGFS